MEESRLTEFYTFLFSVGKFALEQSLERSRVLIAPLSAPGASSLFLYSKWKFSHIELSPTDKVSAYHKEPLMSILIASAVLPATSLLF